MRLEQVATRALPALDALGTHLQQRADERGHVVQQLLLFKVDLAHGNVQHTAPIIAVWHDVWHVVLTAASSIQTTNPVFLQSTYRNSTRPAFISCTADAMPVTTVPSLGLGIMPLGPSSRAILLNLPIMSGVARHLSKLIDDAPLTCRSSISAAPPTTSAPEDERGFVSHNHTLMKHASASVPDALKQANNNTQQQVGAYLLDGRLLLDLPLQTPPREPTAQCHVAALRPRERFDRLASHRCPG